MAFNVKNNRKVGASGPVKTQTVSTVQTGNGAPGFEREESGKSELFLTAVGSFFGQDKFYETKDAGQQRFVGLVQKVTKADPAWMVQFLTWLRNDANIRSAAVVGSVEAALVAKDFKLAQPPNGIGLARQLAKAGLSRADEVGEAMAYFQNKYSKRNPPKPLKRGLADQLTKLTEYDVSKWDSDKHSWKLADLINMLHPDPVDARQADLFGYLLAKRYEEVAIPKTLNQLVMRKNILGLSVEGRRNVLTQPNAADLLREAGMTWEALAGWLQGPMDKTAWEAIIPSMGYMALLRNLRNFDEAGVDDSIAARVAARLADPVRVARSKQFPFRFLSAYRTVPSLRWGHALSQALEHSLVNIPKLDGRTLVLVDTSGSMAGSFSDNGAVKLWDAASIFGIALAKAGNDVDLWSYSGGSTWADQSNLKLKQFVCKKGAPVLAEAKAWKSGGFNFGGGTPTAAALRATYKAHNRVVILTDEQANPDQLGVSASVPANRHLHTINLAGYKAAHAPGVKYRHTWGGLTDKSFSIIPMVERGVDGQWPWLVQA